MISIFLLIIVYSSLLGFITSIDDFPSFKLDLDYFALNRSALSITSFSVDRGKPQWVIRNLGEESKFYPQDMLKRTNQQKVYVNGSKLFSHVFVLPEYALHPQCSVQMLGYAVLEKESPFLLKWRSVKPSVGKGYYKFGTEKWDCFYRAVYENWRPDMNTVNNYWPVVIYCPSPNNITSCNNIQEFHQKHQNDVVTTKVAIHLDNNTWEISLPLSTKYSKLKNDTKEEMLICA
eukprot:gene17431-24100_t